MGDSILKFHKGKFEFSPRAATTQTEIKDTYEEWLYQKAQKLFSKKVKKYSKELGIDVQKIMVKNLKNRWGA